jgi:hypothetical protein
MGEGVTRLMSILLAIGFAQNGIVLIDEIENGLHYSVLEKVWGGIAEAARKNPKFTWLNTDHIVKPDDLVQNNKSLVNEDRYKHVDLIFEYVETVLKDVSSASKQTCSSLIRLLYNRNRSPLMTNDKPFTRGKHQHLRQDEVEVELQGYKKIIEHADCLSVEKSFPCTSGWLSHNVRFFFFCLKNN